MKSSNDLVDFSSFETSRGPISVKCRLKVSAISSVLLINLSSVLIEGILLSDLVLRSITWLIVHQISLELPEF